jgi:putative ATP-dependent endonuclease of OLD family
MKLISFTVRNYRSIIEAYKLSLDNYTVLVGPNNEGKSNLLKAIVLSLNLLTRGRARVLPRRGPAKYYRSGFDFDFNWERDFPLSLQAGSPDGRSEFTLEFGLDAGEMADFRRETHANLASVLKVRLHFGHDEVGFEVLMQGPAKKALNEHRAEIAEFIRTRIAAQYISAIRPSDMASEIIDSVVDRDLAILDGDKEYQKLAAQLQALRQPILDKIAGRLKESISEFVSGIRDVSLIAEGGFARSARGYRLLIDDGVSTDLALKGDGVVSLATIALMRYISQETLGQRNLILSIEEPESHLHPRSIHALRKVLRDISVEHQVIITTHSPIMVERETIRQNILVLQGRAVRARKIDEIRDALGIQLSDNLIGAFLVLLVEGEEDKDILNAWLKGASPAVGNALGQRILLIDHLAGATNLAYKASFYKQNVCNIHAFLDNDDDGRNAVKGAVLKGVLEEPDYNLASCPGMHDSEVEDLISLDYYVDLVREAYGVNLDQLSFRRGVQKWSDRVKEVFQASGKIWDKQTKIGLKGKIADVVAKHGVACLDKHRRDSVDALIQSLEGKLQERTR